MSRSRPLVLGVHAIERAVNTSVECLEDSGWLATLLLEWIKQGNRLAWFGYETKLRKAEGELLHSTRIWDANKKVVKCELGDTSPFDNAHQYMEQALGRGFKEPVPEVDAVLITGSRINYEELAAKWLLIEHCVDNEIPCFFWDLDFTLPRIPWLKDKTGSFIKTFPVKWMPEQYMRQVISKMIYLSSIVDYEHAKLDIYNPVEWHGFFDWKYKRPVRVKHKYDVVYVGSTGNRSKHFHKWYGELEGHFSVDVWGNKQSDKLKESMRWVNWHEAVNPNSVPDVLNSGRVCIQSARDLYRRLTWQTFRIGEVIMAGSILISPSDVLRIERFIGPEFTFETPDQMLSLVDQIMGLSYEDYVEVVRYQRRLISGQSPACRVARLTNMIYDLNRNLW